MSLHPHTIEELLRTKVKHPFFDIQLAKDICRRIKRIEKKLGIKVLE